MAIFCGSWRRARRVASAPWVRAGIGDLPAPGWLRLTWRWDGDEPGAYVDLHELDGRVERVDQNHVKYFLELEPGKKKTVTYRVTNKNRKVGPELNTQKIRRPL